MLQKLYVHNFRCLVNFELHLSEMPSVLLIGRNGAGKTTVRLALEVFQKIGRGISRVSNLINSMDICRLPNPQGGHTDMPPIRFELEALLKGQIYKYTLALEWPTNFKEARVLQEDLLVNGTPLYTRESAQVTFRRRQQANDPHESKFLVDWHVIALPVIQVLSEVDPLHIFKEWLAQMLLLAPVPSLINGASTGETLRPSADGTNFAEWFSGVLGRYPAAYTHIERYLREIIPDLEDIQNEMISKDAKTMSVRFEKNQGMRLYFDQLSDGEKCFFIGALVLAANKFYGPLLCLWDEPDNYLSLPEIGHFIIALRRAAKDGSQLIVTSHNPEAIRKFSDENTLVLFRSSRLDPSRSKWLSEVVANNELQGDLVEALTRGEIL